MRKYFMWFCLLNKRLYKKATFVILLMLIPLVVVALSIISSQDSGFITVSLAKHDPNDIVSTKIVNELKSENKLVRFIEASTPDEAIEQVKMGKSDAAWIFPKDMQQKMNEFIDSPNQKNAFVDVVQRENTVPLTVSHEKLSGILYKYCARTVYINFIRANASELDDITDEQLFSYYDNFRMEGELFEFAYPEGSAATDNIREMNYLMSPVRGLLSVIAVLCGLAAAMFCIQDEKKGLFAWVKQSSRFGVSLICIGIAVLNVSVVMLISIFVTGINVSVMRELAALGMFMICTTVFCSLLKTVFNSIKLLSSITPLLTVLMIAICPVFFDLKSVRVFQYLFPPTYYLNAVFMNEYFLYAAAYSATGLLLTLLLRKMLKRQ